MKETASASALFMAGLAALAIGRRQSEEPREEPIEVESRVIDRQ